MKNRTKIALAAALLMGASTLVACGGNKPTNKSEKEEKVQVYKAYCEFAGNFFMAGKGDLGPLPAETIFYADYTWEAHATGKAMYSDYVGSWEYSNSSLSMKLLEQDGYAKEAEDQIVEIDTSDARLWSWTLSHQDDRGTGMKYHKNHMSKYGFLKAYNEKLDKSETLPEEPTFTYTFDDGVWQSGWTGDTRVGDLTGSMASISGKVGDEITLPACGYTLEGKSFTGYTVFDGFKTAAKPGDKITIKDWDISIRSNFA